MVEAYMLVDLISRDELFEAVWTLDEVLAVHVLYVGLQIVLIRRSIAAERAPERLYVRMHEDMTSTMRSSSISNKVRCEHIRGDYSSDSNHIKPIWR